MGFGIGLGIAVGSGLSMSRLLLVLRTSADYTRPADSMDRMRRCLLALLPALGLPLLLAPALAPALNPPLSPRNYAYTTFHIRLHSEDATDPGVGPVQGLGLDRYSPKPRGWGQEG